VVRRFIINVMASEKLHRIKPSMRRLAADNRREPTQPERILWSLLRKSQLGDMKFRRQSVIGPYIVDFLCPELKLIVEVDGESHIGRAVDDSARTAFLESKGFRVMRVTNNDVLGDLEAVGMAILLAAGRVDSNGRAVPPNSPSLEGEGWGVGWFASIKTKFMIQSNLPQTCDK
jgi:very-short-patch-repair endonuclease